MVDAKPQAAPMLGRKHRTRLISAAGVGLAAAALVGCPPPSPTPRPGERSAAAPDSFRVAFETSRGRFDAIAHRAWAPLGVDRFYDLVRRRYYDDARFFRVVSGFVAQFGLSGDPRVSEAWRSRPIADEPVRQSNRRGRIAFARGGPNTRTTQLYINLRDNTRLDTLSGFGFPPIAEVVSGMRVVDSLHAGYGEGPPRGRGPAQDSIRASGNDYLGRVFPRLDFIRRARVVREWRGR
jgi:peptidyl-prolyl cis-trans isomerase A (cyclophilin A)